MAAFGLCAGIQPLQRAAQAHTSLTRRHERARVCACAAGVRPYLERLQGGEDLGTDAGAAVSALVDGLAAGTVSDAEAGGMLVLMPPSGVSPTAISSIAAMLRRRMRRASLDGPLLDVVGTGGDGLNTVNISTAAAIVAAAAGARVAKSGNRSASSKSGSADVLEALGVQLGDGDQQLLRRCMDRARICYLFARNHHPALKAVASVRKSLGLRTVFNVLGPLVHPVPASRVVLGVYDEALVEPIAYALAGLNTERAMVVHCAGLDEIAPIDDAAVMYVRDGEVVSKGVERLPTNVAGVQRCSVSDLVGGDAAHNAEVIRDVFGGVQSPVTDAILLNAGAGCVMYGLEETLEGGINRARRAIETGAATATLRKWAEATQTAAAST